MRNRRVLPLSQQSTGAVRGQTGPAFHHGICGAGGHPGTQLACGGQRGGDVLTEFQIRDVGAACGQRRTQHGPVGHALAGRGCDAPADGAGRMNGYQHRPLHIAADGPCHLAALGHGLCKGVRGQHWAPCSRRGGGHSAPPPPDRRHRRPQRRSSWVPRGLPCRWRGWGPR